MTTTSKPTPRRVLLIDKLKPIDSVDSLLQSVKTIRGKYDSLKREKAQIWYRGHSTEYYSLKPSIGRPAEYSGKVREFGLRTEDSLIHKFRRRVYSEVGRVIGEWEALMLARHYGFPCRLLDWTGSPLAALYFACSENQGANGQVWGIAKYEEDEHDLDIFALASSQDEEGPLVRYLEFGKKTSAQNSLVDRRRIFEEIDKSDETKEVTPAIKILHPIDNSPRIIAQSGIFTYHSQPHQTLDSYVGKDFNPENLDIQCLIRWEIPGNKKAAIIKELESLRVNRRTMFPDLEGLAKGLVDSEVLRSGEDLTEKQKALKVLGLSYDATKAEIKEGYENKVKSLTDAYKLLS